MKVTIIEITPEDLAAAPSVFEKLMESLQDVTLKANTVTLETEPTQGEVKPTANKAEEKKPSEVKEKKVEPKPKAKEEPKAEVKQKAEPKPENKTEPKPENEEAKKEPTPEPEPKTEATPTDDTVEPPANAPTLDAMKKRVMEIKKADGSKWDGIKSLIIKYGNGKISEIPEDKRNAFMKEVEEL